MRDLDRPTAEAAKQVGDEVVFDLVFGEPGEHREHPKHHGFDLGRGKSEGKKGRFPVNAARLGRYELGRDYNILLLVIYSFKIRGTPILSGVRGAEKKRQGLSPESQQQACALAGALLACKVYKT